MAWSENTLPHSPRGWGRDRNERRLQRLPINSSRTLVSPRSSLTAEAFAERLGGDNRTCFVDPSLSPEFARQRC
jgi:hypothetical protein